LQLVAVAGNAGGLVNLLTGHVVALASRQTLAIGGDRDCDGRNISRARGCPEIEYARIALRADEGRGQESNECDQRAECDRPGRGVSAISRAPGCAFAPTSLTLTLSLWLAPRAACAVAAS